MCAHYESPSDRAIRNYIEHLPRDLKWKHDMWPGYGGVFLRKPKDVDEHDEAVGPYEALLGRWGLVPHWSKDDKVRNTYNARSETVAEKPMFRDAWKKGNRCIVPAQAFYEPDWRSGKAVSTRFERTDGESMGIAGIFSDWQSPTTGEWTRSYTMLTINADKHPLLQNFHKPNEEKRMVVILPDGTWEDWLNASAGELNEFMRPYSADRLSTSTEPAANDEIKNDLFS